MLLNPAGTAPASKKQQKCTELISVYWHKQMTGITRPQLEEQQPDSNSNSSRTAAAAEPARGMHPALGFTSTHTHGPMLLNPAGMTPASRHNRHQDNSSSSSTLWEHGIHISLLAQAGGRHNTARAGTATASN
jgi:hypothetical protein